ncbi:MAG: PQQ-binding-like beta-propeller repeat protein, partial [Bryobacteraceae bacterium]
EVTHGFSTPILYKPEKGLDELIVPGSYQINSYDVKTGKKLWWVRGLAWQVKSVPLISSGVLYFNNWAPGGDPGQQVELSPFDQVTREYDANHDGKLAKEELPKPLQPTGTWEAVDLDRDGLLNERDWIFFRARRASENSTMAIKLGGRGDLTATNVLWKFRKSLPDVPSPLLYQGVLFLVKTGGIATTLNPATGEMLKQDRLSSAPGDYYSSPVGADGKVYMTSQAGKVSVLTAVANWEVLAVNDLEEDTFATPAIEDGRLYIRTRSVLYCFANKGKRDLPPVRYNRSFACPQKPAQPK